jgi:hypothetical protein
VSAKYFLPCRCGQQVVVEPRQAGQTVVCPCGEMLPVPTMLEITALEPVPPEPSLPAAREGWGRAQRMVLLGGVMLFLAIVAGIALQRTRPVAQSDIFDSESIRESAKTLSPPATWYYWTQMKQGLDRRTDQQYEAAMVRFRVWMVMAVIAALCGAALIGIGVAKRKRSANG